MTTQTQDLAIFGGPPAVTREPLGDWPVTDDADTRAVLDVLESGQLVSDRNVRTPVEELETRWATFLGTEHCVAVSNGTTGLEIALLAEGIQPGDHVVVPALSFVATAMAVIHVGAVPIYVDIDPTTYNLDPAKLPGVLTPQTVAIVPVHLHGLSVDLEAVESVARAHGLKIIEDAAQAHGARLGERPCGASGHTAVFSLQMTKNLPTCGEGGLIVTDNADVSRACRLLRQFGERIRTGQPRRYVSYRTGFNAKLSNIQAAYTISQLDRFADYHRRRAENVRSFLRSLAGVEGLRVPAEPAGYEHAWHILRFGLDDEAFDGHVAPSQVRVLIMRALRAEGVPVSRYQVLPMPEQPALSQQTQQEPATWQCAASVINTTFTLQQRHLRPDAGPLLSEYARAFSKVILDRFRLLASVR